MADEKKNTGGNDEKPISSNADNEEQKKPAAEKIMYGEYRATAKEYKRAKKQQEILDNQLKKCKQENLEKQEKQENLDISNCGIDIDTGAILVNGKPQPQLDPNSPQYDPALYNQYATALNERLADNIEQLADKLTQYKDAVMNSETMKSIIDSITEVVTPVLANVKQLTEVMAESPALTNFKEGLKYIADHSEEIKQRLEEWERLQPYLEEELKKPEYNGRTLDDLLENEYKDENGNLIEEGLFNKALTAAKAAMLEKQLPVIFVNSKLSEVDYPLDKVNANIWRLLQDADTTGQLTFATEKRGSKKPTDIIYALDFTALEEETGVKITKQLTAFDKRVYIAAGALFNNGFKIITVAQIYNAMGNTSRPSANDIKKINASLTKMQAAHVYLNNISESEIYKYDKFIYDASLLPMERITAVVNGQEVDSAIHLFREPPLITFARERKQITTISRKLLESPLSKTDANLLIDDYLLERLSHIKNSKGKINNKLLYATIYDKCHITTTKQRSRAKEKITKYLEHYKKCKFIKDFTEEADGITIVY